MNLDAHVMSLSTLFDPQLAEGLHAILELRLGEQRFRADVADRRLEIVRGEASQPDAIFETTPARCSRWLTAASSSRTPSARASSRSRAIDTSSSASPASTPCPALRARRVAAPANGAAVSCR